MADATREANRILALTWGSTIPVDPARIAGKLGIDVVRARLDPGVSGQLVKRVGVDPVIHLNRQDARNRQRFTCAHELGHFVRRSQEPSLFDIEQYAYVDKRDPLSSKGESPDEIWANNFAAALLMPEKVVRRNYDENPSVVELAYRFDVSPEAMRFRLQNLGYS